MRDSLYLVLVPFCFGKQFLRGFGNRRCRTKNMEGLENWLLLIKLAIASHLQRDLTTEIALLICCANHKCGIYISHYTLKQQWYNAKCICVYHGSVNDVGILPFKKHSSKFQIEELELRPVILNVQCFNRMWSLIFKVSFLTPYPLISPLKEKSSCHIVTPLPSLMLFRC